MASTEPAALSYETVPPLAGGGESDHRAAVAAGFMGWMLDAFDFFVLTLTLKAVAKDLHVGEDKIALVVSLTLFMRPVGALIFGLLADRYGRRRPLMANLVFYSALSVASGLAPNFGTFLVCRLLFGIGMGGEWGVGATLAMEKVPPRLRGVLSGLLQEGYAAGSLLASVVYFLVFPHFGWRPLFFIGGLPALLALFVRSHVKESATWERSRSADWSHLGGSLLQHWRTFLAIAGLMLMMNLASHGTQDMFPTLLKDGFNLSPHWIAIVNGTSNLGAICGGIPGRPAQRPPRPAAGDDPVVRAGHRRRAAVGLRPLAGRADGRRVPDPVHGPGGLGRDPGPHHRAVAGQRPRVPARLRLPVRRRRRRLHHLRPRRPCTSTSPWPT